MGICDHTASILPMMRMHLPPGCQRTSWNDLDREYSIDTIPCHASNIPIYRLKVGADLICQSVEPPRIVRALQRDMEMYLAVYAQDVLFVHAGVVGWKDRAIVLPGRSFSGKSTLVSALLRAGADYFSDEYAVFDSGGRVWPYPRLLRIRTAGNTATHLPAEHFNGQTASESLRVGLVAKLVYHRGTHTAPHSMTRGEAVLELLQNTPSARGQPSFVLGTLRQAVGCSLGVRGQRGEADITAAFLMRMLS